MDRIPVRSGAVAEEPYDSLYKGWKSLEATRSWQLHSSSPREEPLTKPPVAITIMQSNKQGNMRASGWKLGDQATELLLSDW